jgi:protein-S-isoprenylcysteine O-methyltransferase Ste14
MSQKRLIIKLIVRLVSAFIIFVGILFGTAGTFKWLEAWLLIIIFFSYAIAAAIWLRKNNPDLLADRLIFMKKTGKAWDRALMLGILPFSIALLIIPGLDAVRYQWSQVPIALKIISFVIIVAAAVWTFWVMKENTYLSRVVEIQRERQHRVITTGPYKYVRHPMYSGGIIFIVCTPLALGSLFGLIPAAFMIIVFIFRTYLEDRTLRNELPGYKKYAKKTKYRLLPGVW